MTLTKRWRAALDDEGVSPVIAVILMVAITVVLAATVYVWVSGFATEDTGPEQASATASGVDLDDDGDVEWVKVTLTKGENAPYDHDDTTLSVTNSSGGDISEVCEVAKTDGNSDPGPLCKSGEDFGADSGDSWDVGENLWIPCQDDDGSSIGTHLITASVRGSTILDTSITCEAEAQTT